MKKCPTCDHELDDSAVTCPNCGRTFAKQLHPVFKVLIILGVLLVFIVLYLYIEKFIDITRNPLNLLPIPAQELILF
jgi:hypothetical protein